MRRLFAGLIVIAVAAGVLAWFAQGVAVGQDPGEADQLSSQAMTAEMPEDAYTFGQAGVAELVPQDKYEDFEGPWPNDWVLMATHNKFWGPNKCLAYEGSYDGWVEAFGPDGHPSHTDSPACTSPTASPTFTGFVRRRIRPMHSAPITAPPSRVTTTLNGTSPPGRVATTATATASRADR